MSIRVIREKLQELLREAENLEREIAAGRQQQVLPPPGSIFERTHTGTFRDRLRDSFRGRLNDLCKGGG